LGSEYQTALNLVLDQFLGDQERDCQAKRPS
jgi:hypothetical protein